MHTSERPTTRRARARHPGERRDRQTVGVPAGIPGWVQRLDVPVWVSGPDGTLRYVNRKAERLLGMRAADWLGRPCHEAVAGRDEDGRAICEADCRVACRAARGATLPSIDARVGRGAGRTRWTRWTVIPVADDSDAGDERPPWLVHTATDLGRSRECEQYLQRLAARSVALREMDPTFRPRALTPRESEVLGLLAEDRELGAIARDLGISRATVRNHVQRLTAAIGAHSVHEAVAMRLLGRV